MKKLILIIALALVFLISGCATTTSTPTRTDGAYWDAHFEKKSRERSARSEYELKKYEEKISANIDAMETIMFGEREADKLQVMLCIHTQSFIEGEDIRRNRENDEDFTHILSFAYDRDEIYYSAVSYDALIRSRELGREGDFIMQNRKKADWATIMEGDLVLRDEKNSQAMIVQPFKRPKGQTRYYSTVSIFADEDYREDMVFWCQISAR